MSINQEKKPDNKEKVQTDLAKNMYTVAGTTR